MSFLFQKKLGGFFFFFDFFLGSSDKTNFFSLKKKSPIFYIIILKIKTLQLVGPSCSNADLHMPIHINEKYYIIWHLCCYIIQFEMSNLFSVGKILPKIENFKVFWKVFNSEK